MPRSKILGMILITAAVAFLVPWEAPMWFRVLLTLSMSFGILLMSV